MSTRFGVPSQRRSHTANATRFPHRLPRPSGVGSRVSRDGQGSRHFYRGDRGGISDSLRILGPASAAGVTQIDYACLFRSRRVRGQRVIFATPSRNICPAEATSRIAAASGEGRADAFLNR